MSFAASGFANSGFQTGGVTAADGLKPAGSGSSSGKRKRRRSVLEVDGELIEVSGVDEARAILAQLRADAEVEAPIAANRALNRARKIERKSGELPAIDVEPPQISAQDVSDSLQASVARTRMAIAAIYAKAARDAELALLAKRAYIEQDEEDAIMVLLA